MVALIPTQVLLCEHIQVPQLTPSPLYSHELISHQIWLGCLWHQLCVESSVETIILYGVTSSTLRS